MPDLQIPIVGRGARQFHAGIGPDPRTAPPTRAAGGGTDKRLLPFRRLRRPPGARSGRSTRTRITEHPHPPVVFCAASQAGRRLRGSPRPPPRCAHRRPGADQRPRSPAPGAGPGAGGRARVQAQAHGLRGRNPRSVHLLPARRRAGAAGRGRLAAAHARRRRERPPRTGAAAAAALHRRRPVPGAHVPHRARGAGAHPVRRADVRGWRHGRGGGARRARAGRRLDVAAARLRAVHAPAPREHPALLHRARADGGRAGPGGDHPGDPGRLPVHHRGRPLHGEPARARLGAAGAARGAEGGRLLRRGVAGVELASSTATSSCSRVSPSARSRSWSASRR